MDESERTAIALWRYGVLGPLVSADRQHGDVRALCEQAAGRRYRRPDGRTVTVGARTVENWFYAYIRGGLDGLRPVARRDMGQSRAISEPLAQRVLELKREKPRRSIRRIIRALERAGEVTKGALKKSTVHRLLRAHGLSERPAREDATERRAFRHPHAGDCWMGDVMHGPKALDDRGTPRKSYLHAFIDSATRLVAHGAFRLGERASDHAAVLKSAIRKHGTPRMLYLDNGAAQSAESLGLTCAELGIHLVHTRAYDPEAKGAIERFFKTVRAEILDELDEQPEDLADLNAKFWAWLATEYHRRGHAGTRRVPLEHWLDDAQHLRPAPDDATLDRAFLLRETRRVKNDSTVQFRGERLEVRGELVGKTVELRFDPERDFAPSDRTTWPKVFIDGHFACDTVVLDRIGNSLGKRRRLPRTKPPESGPSGIDPLAQMADEQARRTRRPRDLDPQEDG